MYISKYKQLKINTDTLKEQSKMDNPEKLVT
jgi:hypothetical protein